MRESPNQKLGEARGTQASQVARLARERVSLGAGEMDIKATKDNQQFKGRDLVSC